MIIEGETHFSRKYYYSLKYAFKFLVASSGMTNDCRELTKDDIERIVANHNSGYLSVSISRSPEEWYNPLGVVSNLECNVIGGKAYLYAEVRVSEKLIKLSQGWDVAHYFAIAITDDCNDEENSGPRLVNLYLTTEASFNDVEELSFEIGGWR